MPISMPVDAEANELLTRSPLALLIAMLLDQQVPLERAFSAPRDLVRRLGHEPVVSRNGEGDEPADLDAGVIEVGDGSGLLAARRLRELGCPVVLMGVVPADDEARAIAPAAYLVKPFPLHRLERAKWIAAEWKVSENNQRTRVYRLTAKGKKQLISERSRWEQLSDAIAGVLNPAKTEGEL